MHEYYTPQGIADAIAATLGPLLPEVAGRDGVVRAHGPSTGIGRLIRAFSPQRCPGLEVGGKSGLIVSNPPYGDGLRVLGQEADNKEDHRDSE